MRTVVTTTATRATKMTATKPKTRTLVCFSFAAYAKTLIDHLNSLNIPTLPGLTDQEFTSIETAFNFKFPPDLRSILQEGLPIGPHFPNWRSSSPQQLQLLLNLPLLNLAKNISQNHFWVVDSWGDRPLDDEEALFAAQKLLNEAPALVPVYRNCYIPSSPNLAGNPVFYIDDKEVRVLSFDVARFFKETEFLNYHSHSNKINDCGGGGIVKAALDVPAWAAMEARRVEFWTEVAERGRRVVVARDGDAGGWWWCDFGCGDLVGTCLEEACWRLRNGGWKEEEVREMMMMNGYDCSRRGSNCGARSFDFEEDVVWHVRVLSLSLMLLRAGWSIEDVVDSLDLQDFRGDGLLGGNHFWELQV